MNTKSFFYTILAIGLMLIGFNVGADTLAALPVLSAQDAFQGFEGLMLAGTVGAPEAVMRAIDAVERSLEKFQAQAEREIKNSLSVSTETKNAIQALGEKQKELADEILYLKKRGDLDGGDGAGSSPRAGWGGQIIRASAFKEFMSGQRSKAKFDIKNNTITGSTTTVGADRRPGSVPGAFSPLNLEPLFAHVPTSSNMVEYTRENVFTNAAAEAAEGSAKAESSITFTLVQQPVATVAHWLKISKQLAADHAALVAYIETRLAWGVQRRVDGQIVAGNGVAPNLSGFLSVGNYTAHGYTNAQLGTGLKKHKLIRRVISDLRAAGYTPNAIVLNPADWLQFDLDMIDSTPAALSSQDIAAGFVPALFGVPVVESNAITADNFLVMDTVAAATIYDRQDVTVEMSDSDSDNFTKNLITVRAERRLALAVEQPAAVRGGDLTPA